MAHSPALQRGLVRDHHNPARVIVLVRGRIVTEIVTERKSLTGCAIPCRDSVPRFLGSDSFPLLRNINAAPHFGLRWVENPVNRVIVKISIHP